MGGIVMWIAVGFVGGLAFWLPMQAIKWIVGAIKRRRSLTAYCACGCGEKVMLIPGRKARQYVNDTHAKRVERARMRARRAAGVST